jgi:SAM-dependent methyltransferase
MKANTDRTGRLHFDRLADAYDRGRPGIPAALVAEAARGLRLAPGARVLEVGAGTGQLTRPLLAAGFRVVALEPGANLRARLRAGVPEDAPLTISDAFFEDYAGAAGSFASLWAANAFHWLDPKVSYRNAARLLRRSGSLVLLWTYPILKERLQEALNEHVFAPLCPHFIREADGYLERLRRETEEGRQEIRYSGQFDDPLYWFELATIDMSVEHYIVMLMSYGHVAAMEQRERAQLGERVRDVLGERGAAEGVAVRNHVYVCTARKRVRSEAVG